MLDHRANDRVFVPAVASDDPAQLAQRALAVGAAVEALGHLERDPGVIERPVARGLQDIDGEGGGRVGAADHGDRGGDQRCGNQRRGGRLRPQRRLARSPAIERLLALADLSHNAPHLSCSRSEPHCITQNKVAKHLFRL